MVKVFEITIKESKTELNKLHNKEKSFKKKLRIMSLILTLENKFSTREEIANFIGVDTKTLYKWTKKYKDFGISAMLESTSGGKRRESVPKSIHKEIEKNYMILSRLYRGIMMLLIG